MSDPIMGTKEDARSVNQDDVRFAVVSFAVEQQIKLLVEIRDLLQAILKNLG